MVEHYKRDILVCDFCEQPHPEWAYPTDDFSQELGAASGRIEYNSSGGWAACQECYELIEANERDELVRRSLRSMGVPLTDWKLQKRVRALHDEFFLMRSGDPIPDEEYVDPPGKEAGVASFEMFDEKFRPMN